jgi:hypothetical protein
MTETLLMRGTVGCRTLKENSAPKKLPYFLTSVRVIISLHRWWSYHG